ncbi:BTAD domain-containing putative transcriptional regulator [Streptomyces sp. NPDC088124]|uniref:AfsR/SARP family transcriptional regulator n=1 Tax=Streptomyces sp. NPDC088124 TaxID=3154654 RepID=UPI00343FE76D
MLGPVRILRGEEQLPSGRPQERAVLAALLLRRGRTATVAELVDAVWGEEPPLHAVAALRTYAFRLRKTLGPGVLDSEAGGYALRAEPRNLDLAVCEELARQADQARERDDHSLTRTLLHQAADLWQGETLGGVPGPYAHAQRSRLEELRLSLLEARAEADLTVGLHTETIGELTVLSTEHPLRERLRALLMLALYRAGRQAEALSVYGDTRRLLADELGVDPGPELAELHGQILRADPALTAPGTSTPGIPGAAHEYRAPAQLPAALADFTGRTASVAEVCEHLLGTDGPAMPVSVVRGLGGVGKTALAVQAAHSVREHFPDGQLYTDLLGHSSRPADPAAVLGMFLRALSVPPAALPKDVAERAALYRSVLADRRVLVVLDNARDAAHVRPLLPGTPGCAVLATSRTRITDLDGARLTELGAMTPAEALSLFRRVIGLPRADAEPAACREAIEACGFLPLAIRIAAARLAARPAWDVASLATRLADERRRLDELRAGNLAVEATFALGYGQLTPPRARAFRLLAVIEAPDLPLPAAVAVIGASNDDPVRDERATEALLESLVDLGLLESAAPARWHYHDLLRLYARRRADLEESADERRAALARLLDSQLATTAHVYALHNPGDRLLDHLTPTNRTAPAFNDGADALRWLHREGPGLLAAVQQAAGEPELLRHAADVLLTAQDLMETGALAHLYERAARALAESARTASDTRTEGRARLLLGQTHHLTGRLESAETEAQRALNLGRSAQDPLTHSYAENLLGNLATARHQYEQAAAHYQRALNTFRADGNRYGETAMLMNVARADLELGRTQQAITASEQVIRSWQRLGATLRLANGHYALALALHRADRHDQALDQLHEALAGFEVTRQSFWQGMTRYRMAQAELARQQPHRAAAHAEDALVLLGGLGGTERRVHALVLLGEALRQLGQAERARTCWQQALPLLAGTQPSEAARLRALLTDSP